VNSFAVLNKATNIAANQVQNAEQTEQAAQRLISNKARKLHGSCTL
jgi:glutamate synthase (NADPH/NADH) large chain